MNIGLYLTDYSPQTGGGYTFQEEILNSLVEMGDTRHTFVVLCRNAGTLREGTNSSRMRFRDVPTTRDRVVHKIRLALRPRGVSRCSFEQLLQREKIDFLWFAGPECMSLDLPYLTVVWDLQHRLQPWFPEVSSKGEWERRERLYSSFLRRAAVIVAANCRGKSEIERFYQIPPERIRVLPHPTPAFALSPPESDDNAVLRQYDIAPGYLFYPAQFWPHKNHVSLLLAAKILSEKHGIDVSVLLVGSDKGNRRYVEHTAKELGLANRVRILGFVPQQHLVALYRNAMALVYVSCFGPENLPPLEAFALGCPVVASDVAGSEEQLGEAALRVNATDPEEIACAIQRLWRDQQLRHALIQHGRERARRWKGRDFVAGVLDILDDFESVRRLWPST